MRRGQTGCGCSGRREEWNAPGRTPSQCATYAMLPSCQQDSKSRASWPERTTLALDPAPAVRFRPFSGLERRISPPPPMPARPADICAACGGQRHFPHTARIPEIGPATNPDPPPDEWYAHHDPAGFPRCHVAVRCGRRRAARPRGTGVWHGPVARTCGTQLWHGRLARGQTTEAWNRSTGQTVRRGRWIRLRGRATPINRTGAMRCS